MIGAWTTVKRWSSSTRGCLSEGTAFFGAANLSRIGQGRQRCVRRSAKEAARSRGERSGRGSDSPQPLCRGCVHGRRGRVRSGALLGLVSYATWDLTIAPVMKGIPATSQDRPGVGDLRRPRPCACRPCSQPHLEEPVAGIEGRGGDYLEVEAAQTSGAGLSMVVIGHSSGILIPLEGVRRID